jgi:acyl-CoA reductase-like NAD-dependent aldehyde dehydrogenase
MTRREAIEGALAAWRDADRRLSAAADEERGELARQVTRYRSEFQQLSADHMVERIDKLREAESRRVHATPSTPPFHEAARDTQEIAGDIWEAARLSDEDTPQTVENRRTTPRPARPGSGTMTPQPAGSIAAPEPSTP